MCVVIANWGIDSELSGVGFTKCEWQGSEIVISSDWMGKNY
jgi:hypothetical protein